MLGPGRSQSEISRDPRTMSVVGNNFPQLQTASMLAWTGIGKHSREEQIGIGSDDIRAISKYLGGKHYFCGFKPSRIDAALFAVLAQIVYAPYENEHLEIIKKECSNLMEYVERIKNR
ncbi:hypothetical protein COOONC_16502, partial [Cooperia oncophora]